MCRRLGNTSHRKASRLDHSPWRGGWTFVGQTSAANQSLKLASVVRPTREIARAIGLVGFAYESSQYCHNMAADIGLRCLQLNDTTSEKF